MVYTISWHSTFFVLQQKFCITGSSLLVQFLVAMLPLIFSTVVLLLVKNQGCSRSNYFSYCVVPFCYETPTHTGCAFEKINFYKFYFQSQRMLQSSESPCNCFNRTRIANISKLVPVEEAQCCADGWRNS